MRMRGSEASMRGGEGGRGRHIMVYALGERLGKGVALAETQPECGLGQGQGGQSL